MKVNNEFDFGDIVYLKTDTEQLKRIITGLYVRPTGLLYTVNAGTICSEHYECELSIEQDLVLKVS